jgi:hypothetical protein
MDNLNFPINEKIHNVGFKTAIGQVMMGDEVDRL